MPGVAYYVFGLKHSLVHLFYTDLINISLNSLKSNDDNNYIIIRKTEIEGMEAVEESWKRWGISKIQLRMLVLMENKVPASGEKKELVNVFFLANSLPLSGLKIAIDFILILEEFL